MVNRLVLVLGDQLSMELSALREAEKDEDIVVMAEVAEEAGYVKHHPKKIALIFAAMRKFAVALQQTGWTVRYAQLDDTQNAGSIVGELLRRAEETGAKEVLCTEPGEWRLIEKLKHAPIKTRILPDDRLVFHQIDHTFEISFGPNRQLNHQRHGPKARFHHIAAALKVCLLILLTR